MARSDVLEEVENAQRPELDDIELGTEYLRDAFEAGYLQGIRDMESDSVRDHEDASQAYIDSLDEEGE